MKLIKLTRGLFAQVDDEDYEYLNQFNWYAAKGHNTPYAMRTTFVNGKRTQLGMHRQIMEMAGKGMVVDHKDLDGLNNQKYNLRICTQSQNTINSKKNNKQKTFSKYKGVTRRKDRGTWKAHIGVNNKRIELGNYKNEVDAAKAYNEGAKKYHGEFAYLNVIE